MVSFMQAPMADSDARAHRRELVGEVKSFIAATRSAGAQRDVKVVERVSLALEIAGADADRDIRISGSDSI